MASQVLHVRQSLWLGASRCAHRPCHLPWGVGRPSVGVEAAIPGTCMLLDCLLPVQLQGVLKRHLRGMPAVHPALVPTPALPLCIPQGLGT